MSCELEPARPEAVLHRLGRRPEPWAWPIAAIADHHEVGVLHYDAHYDLIVAKTDLAFTSEWLAPAGSLS